jgi:hypothetical protein
MKREATRSLGDYKIPWNQLTGKMSTMQCLEFLQNSLFYTRDPKEPVTLH